MNYYRRYMGDYLAKTASLSLAEHGAYNVLLDTCYSTERPLPADYDALFRLCRAMTRLEQEAVRKVADDFFPIGGDGLRHNRRADEEIAKAQRAVELQRESGFRSAAMRWSTDRSTHKDSDSSPIQPPTSNLQPPEANLQPPTTKKNRSDALRAPASEPKTTSTERAYRQAYTTRYGVEPVVNAKVRGMLARFLDRVPSSEAPDIAAFYVASNRQLYVSASHCVDLLLRDAEGLRTQWLNGRATTDSEARQADRAQTTGNAFSDLIREAEERERSAAH